MQATKQEKLITDMIPKKYYILKELLQINEKRADNRPENGQKT